MGQIIILAILLSDPLKLPARYGTKELVICFGAGVVRFSMVIRRCRGEGAIPR